MGQGPEFLAKAGMCFGVVQGEVASSKELKLVECESQNPGDISWSDGEGVFMGWDEGHIVMFHSLMMQ